ncbi:MAG: 16S rRNA (guanine(527)-N(7))-methyltransferase RsmG [Chloroflexi bacterium]|nr:16S rRNA (guanine(527)-N(7))-methyltransferase RsmG [Chloroflexota bacterium]
MEVLIEGSSRLDIELDGEQVERFRTYYDELIAWNRNVNLTAVTSWDEVQERHFLDSLGVASALPDPVLDGSARVLDVGSGAGFPGLPLKIAYPRADLTLLEATAKKTAFLYHVVDKLGLQGVEVVTGRAEGEAHRSEMREQFGAVVSRAVARLDVLAELCLPFCSVGGRMIAQKGPKVEEELGQARRAIDTLGGLFDDRDMLVAPLVGVGTLVTIEKHRPSPANYPRRPGIPSKRPL